LYFASRATGGRCLTEDLATDPILIANMSTVDRIVTTFEATQSADRLIPFLANQTPKIGR
jgi:hypothetical protein